MKRYFANRVAMGIAVFSALLPLLAVPTAEAAAVPPIPRPAKVLAVGPFNSNLETQLQGEVCRSPNTCTTVPYLSFFTPVGVWALQAAVTATPADKIIIFGYSNGTEVAQQWLVQHLDDPNSLPPDRLSFVLIGNPTRKYGGVDPLLYGGDVWPESPYQVIDVSQQYDGASDFPNNPDSPHYQLAVWNANAGFYTTPHIDYRNVDIYDPANAVWTEGNITYVLTPTENLPILGGFATIFPSLNARMKADIETAYIRPVPFPTTTQSASPATSLTAASAPSAPVVSDPTVAAQHTTVPLSLPPAPTAATTGPAPAATGPTTTNSTDTGAAESDTVSTTPPSATHPKRPKWRPGNMFRPGNASPAPSPSEATAGTPGSTDTMGTTTTGGTETTEGTGTTPATGGTSTGDTSSADTPNGAAA